MINKRVFLVFVSLVLFLPALCFADFTGKWNCNDGGTYYLRQVGNTLYWYGEKSGTNPSWSNVYKGRIIGSQIKGHWADVPKGRTSSQGVLNLIVQQNGNVLKAQRKTGGFGGSNWTKTGVSEVSLKRFLLRFRNGYLVYKPGSGSPQIVAQSNVLSYGNDWQIKQMKPYLFHLKQKFWKDFYWKVNTSRKEVYRIKGGTFGQYGGQSQDLNIRVDTVK
jgi:hypothetical protein